MSKEKSPSEGAFIYLSFSTRVLDRRFPECGLRRSTRLSANVWSAMCATRLNETTPMATIITGEKIKDAKIRSVSLHSSRTMAGFDVTCFFLKPHNPIFTKVLLASCLQQSCW